MLTPDVFFDLARFRHAGLFAPDRPVWDAIRHIREHARQVCETFTGKTKAAGRTSTRSGSGRLLSCFPAATKFISLARLACRGHVVRRTTVVHGERMIFSGFRLEPGDVTRGEFKVFVRGRRLESAAVVYAGVALLDDDIVIGEGTVIETGALIKGPTVIGARCDVRQGAYIRGGCIFGDGCVIGHATEVKDSVFLDGAKAGHFAYVGDSILGNRVNLGAGTKLANLKIIESPVRVRVEGEIHDTGLRKFGAIIGDDSELGCNSVTNPGTLLGKHCLVYPCVSVPAAYYPARTILGHAHDALTVRRSGV